MLTDVTSLVGEQVEKPVDDHDLQDYLSEHLEIQGAGSIRDFTAHLRYYVNARHKQCCMCSSSSSTTKLMVSGSAYQYGCPGIQQSASGAGVANQNAMCARCVVPN